LDKKLLCRNYILELLSIEMNRYRNYIALTLPCTARVRFTTVPHNCDGHTEQQTGHISMPCNGTGDRAWHLLACSLCIAGVRLPDPAGADSTSNSLRSFVPRIGSLRSVIPAWCFPMWRRAAKASFSSFFLFLVL